MNEVINNNDITKEQFLAEVIVEVKNGEHDTGFEDKYGFIDKKEYDDVHDELVHLNVINTDGSLKIK